MDIRGLSLTTDEFAKIGVLVLNKGLYNAKRIMPKELLKAHQANSKAVMEVYVLIPQRYCRNRLRGFPYEQV